MIIYIVCSVDPDVKQYVESSHSISVDSTKVSDVRATLSSLDTAVFRTNKLYKASGAMVAIELTAVGKSGKSDFSRTPSERFEILTAGVNIGNSVLLGMNIVIQSCLAWIW